MRFKDNKQQRKVLNENPTFLQSTKTYARHRRLTGLMAGSAARVHASTTSTGAPDLTAAKGQGCG